MGLAHITSLTPSHCIGMLLPIHKSERSWYLILGLFRVWYLILGFFRQSGIWFWDCSDGLVFDFGIVPTVWYLILALFDSLVFDFGIVPTVWYLILGLFRQSGIFFSHFIDNAGLMKSEIKIKENHNQR